MKHRPNTVYVHVSGKLAVGKTAVVTIIQRALAAQGISCEVLVDDPIERRILDSDPDFSDMAIAATAMKSSVEVILGDNVVHTRFEQIYKTEHDL